MLRLSKKADYALMALKHLAADASHGTASAREIAEQYDIPLELLAKVLQQLTRRGLLLSQMGIHGGYHLARPTTTISPSRSATSRNTTPRSPSATGSIRARRTFTSAAGISSKATGVSRALVSGCWGLAVLVA